MKKKFWYRIHRTECPVCGAGDTTRERVYGKKPKEPIDIYTFTEHYDYCDV